MNNLDEIELFILIRKRRVYLEEEYLQKVIGLEDHNDDTRARLFYESIKNSSIDYELIVKNFNLFSQHNFMIFRNLVNEWLDCWNDIDRLDKALFLFEFILKCLIRNPNVEVIKVHFKCFILCK